MTATLTDEVVAEILRDAHRYMPGVEPNRPTLDARRSTLRRRLVHAGHRGRNLAERAAGRAGFTRRHYDAAAGATALLRLLALGDGLQRTADRLGDDASRRTLIDLLKLRVLGPYHAPLAITSDRYRSLQAYADRALLTQAGTMEVADPWFSPLSLYEVPGDDGSPISLHAHSIDVVNVFLLKQYCYRRGGEQVTAQAGDVVLDIGGCFGDTALWFASRVGSGGRVYTFEFDPENLEVMRANLALNPRLADRIEVVDRALWDKSGETLQFTPAGHMTSLSTTGQRSGLMTSTITLDDFVDSAGLGRTDFVKMDVEGSELRVLAGARRALARHSPKLAVAAYHDDADLVLIPDALAEGNDGYRLFLETFSSVQDETVLFARPPG